MSDFEISSDIPPPKRAKYPWDEMEPGDSFLVPCADEDKRRVQMSMNSAASSWCKNNRPDLMHATSQVEDGVRIWLLPKNE